MDEETKKKKKNPHAVALGKLGGKVGGPARAAALTAAQRAAIGRLGAKLGGEARAAALSPKRRKAIAKKAAAALWEKRRKEAEGKEKE